jgi:hypothetical protein
MLIHGRKMQYAAMADLKKMESNMKLRTNSIVAMCAVALGVAVSFPVSAAQPPIAGIVGDEASSVAGCPYLNWRLARHTDGRITGRFWYSDLSGTSVAVGTDDSTGKINIQLTSAIGSGPVGVITGQRSQNGKVVVDLVGQGCANFHAVVWPIVPDIGRTDTP